MTTATTKLYYILEEKNHSVARWLYKYFQREPMWQDMTAVNLKKFTNYLHVHLSPNSARTYLAELKATINLYKDEVDIPVKNLKTAIRTKAVKSTHCYLTIDELYKIEELQGLSRTQEKVRDMFLLQAWTGCRLSDAGFLTSENIIGSTLSYTSQKTKVFASIPVKPLVKEILDRHGRVEVLNRVTYNRVVHQICKMAGIDNEVTVWESGKRVSGKKYEFISSHSARRSFATNLYEAGIAINKISYMMGHTESAMTERYICSNMELSEEVVEFFK